LAISRTRNAAARRDDPGALQHRQKARRRLARGARELGDLGLRCSDEHVVVVGALGVRLLDELGDDLGDAALDRLEGLAREALVGGAQTPRDRYHQLARDARVLDEQAAHVGAEDCDRLDLVDRLHGGRPPLVVEHRQLTEDVPGPEGRERDRAAVGMAAHGAGVAGAHDVAGV
jgi:hypothetical protein